MDDMEMFFYNIKKLYEGNCYVLLNLNDDEENLKISIVSTAQNLNELNF